MAKMTDAQLNELLARALATLRDDGLTIITADDWAKPWLPESYWNRKHEEELAIKAVRRCEDDYLARTVSVADVLEADIPTLSKPPEHTRWGAMPMAASYRRPKTPSTVWQPSYDFECYRCGRPITDRDGDWIDHAGRGTCDHALMPWEDMDDIETWHQPKPVHGEEEDEEG